MTHPHPNPLIREALTLVRPTAADICAALGLPLGTLNAYHAGTRRAPAETAPALAMYLRVHAAALEEMAASLEAKSSEPALA